MITKKIEKEIHILEREDVVRLVSEMAGREVSLDELDVCLYVCMPYGDAQYYIRSYYSINSHISSRTKKLRFCFVMKKLLCTSGTWSNQYYQKARTEYGASLLLNLFFNLSCQE